MDNTNAHNGNNNGRKLTDEEVQAKEGQSQECTVITVPKLSEQPCTPTIEVMEVLPPYTLHKDAKQGHLPGDTLHANEGVEIPKGELPIKNNGERVTRQEPVTIGEGQVEANTAAMIRQSSERKYVANNGEEVKKSSSTDVTR